ncbi:hypothetical protein [Sphaerotilus mobilis]|uniref:N-acetyltransferase domain-containing protein n=1 Tax=Sphaerotilus mobilis TaxID=47994 RepID=A0A4Q7LIX7_9BURK|nr:hypothetical protein [Sphaerotilus mobilis]RZS54515.1 hypothetical protein EV685_1992 [Sphaerotilus mobilis]
MDDRVRRELAALNNACWCEAVCAAHGAGGVIGPAFWLTRHRPPPFHSNLVTVAADFGRDELDAVLASLASAPIAPDWTIKDSHAAFDLVEAGWGELFSAHWIWRDDLAAFPLSTAPAVRLHTPADRVRWERAWHGLRHDDRAELPWRQFPDAVWTDPRHGFYAVLDAQGHISAGAIANRSPGVVGLSNLFVVTGDRMRAWAALTDAIARDQPGRPLVGYERDGDDLDAARAVGFERIGALRVWQHRPA